MSSEAITRNDLSAILNAVIHGKPSEFRKLLWENPSRTSSFAPQTISVNLDGYDEVEVWAIYNTNADGSNISNIITRTKVGENATISMTRPDVFLTQDRVFTTSLSGVTFQNCVLGSSASVYNNHSVPVYIYGIKYERVAPLQLDASDYVIEQGTSGVWTYRKWESGIAECWGTWSGSLTNYATALGGYAYTTEINYPTSLFISPPIHTYSAYVASGFALTGTVTTAYTDKVVPYALSNVGGTATVYFYITSIGRWK